MVALALWVSDDAPLELLLHLQHSLELSASIAPLSPRCCPSSSGRCDAGLLSPIPTDWVDAIDYEEVLEATRIPHPSPSTVRAEAADAGRRLLRLASHSHHWGRQMVIDLAASVEWLPSPWKSGEGAQARVELRKGLQQAVFLGCAAVVLPPLSLSFGDSDCENDVLEDGIVVDFLSELALITESSGSQTKLWLTCSPTVASWRQWNAVRLRLAAAPPVRSADVRQHRRAASATAAVQPVLQRRSDLVGGTHCCAECRAPRRTSTPNCWLGESVACYVLDELDGEALAAAPVCNTAMLWGLPSVDTILGNHSARSTRSEGWSGEAEKNMLPRKVEGELPRLPCCTASRVAWLVEMGRRGVLLAVRRPLLGGESFSQAESVSDDLRCVWRTLHERMAPHMLLPSLDRLRHVEDALHEPLQPLCDNLENAVYSTFEADRVKYERYGAALRRYFHRCCGGPLPVHVVLVGAGRGPLITETLLAAVAANVTVNVVAIEKSYAAVAHLRMRLRFDPGWHQLLAIGTVDHGSTCSSLTIVHADGRQAFCDPAQMHAASHGGESFSAEAGEEAFVKASLIVSELLGSAGDNELAPECVEGVRNQIRTARVEWCRRGRCSVAHSEDASRDTRCTFPSLTCIPESCTFWVAPLQSATLVDKLNALANAGHHPFSDDGVSSVLQSLWLSHIVNGVCLALPQRAWTFEHSCSLVAPVSDGALEGDLDSERNNSSSDASLSRRLCTLRFTVPALRCRVDAFAGYFTAVLASGCNRDGDAVVTSDNEDDEIVLSTVPLSWTQGMVSWFPCVLPLRQSVVPQGPPGAATVSVHLRRNCCPGGVYYQWAVSSAPSQVGTVDGDNDKDELPHWHNEGGTHWKMSLL